MDWKKLKDARIVKGWSQEETARRCGMSLNNYARIERGESGTTVATLERIATELGMRLQLLKK